MCGIFGLVKKQNHRVIQDEMYLMHEAQIHRGPDNFGYFCNDNIFLGNNRLSIIDLSDGNQPFYSKDKNIIVLQNGEIYNYLELKDELVSNNINFETNSDTEVILRLYEQYNLSMLDKLNGMFSISILDFNNNKLHLIRDRFGQKPLYFYDNTEQFIFSSEIKSILDLGIKTSINKNALISYLNYNFVAGRETIYDGIKTVLPGNYLTLDIRDLYIKEYKWWKPEEEINYYQNLIFGNATKNLLDDLVHDLVHDSIKLRMRSDVEYSAFLSGGIDSTIIVSQMNKLSNNKFNTLTIGFENSKFDESIFANEVANELNVNHTCKNVDRSLLSYWDDVLMYAEQPHGDVSFIPMYLLSKYASENDKVVLTGDGADEIFGGYSKYSLFCENKNLKELYKKSSTLFSDIEISKLLNINLNKNFDVLDNLVDSDTVISSDILLSNQNKAMYLDTIFLLPFNNLIKPDKMGMSHSLELRSPFLDYRVMSLALAIKSEDKIANGQSKYILRKAFKDDIPDIIFKRKKQKFIVPLEENDDTIEYFFNQINESNIILEQGLNRQFIENLYFEHTSKKNNNYRKLRAITALSKWYNYYSKYVKN